MLYFCMRFYPVRIVPKQWNLHINIILNLQYFCNINMQFINILFSCFNYFYNVLYFCFLFLEKYGQVVLFIIIVFYLFTLNRYALK